MTSTASRLRSLLCYAFAVGLLAQAADAHAVGEQVGRLRGVVTDPAGRPLDAVTVTATGGALIGGPRTVFSNTAGRYEIAGLPPGEYTVEFSYPGTVPLTRQVIVRTGEAVTLNIAWTVEAQETDTISLRETRQRTRPDSTQTGTGRDYNSANKMPTNRSYQGLTLQVPGTSGGANPFIKGASDRNNRYLIDGMDVTDPVTNTFTKNITFESMGSVDVLTGGMDAEYNAIGGVINVVTKGGGEGFHANAAVYLNHSKFSGSGTYGTNLYELRQPFNDLESGVTQTGEVSVNVGGPIIPRRLWYSATYELSLYEAAQVKGPPLGVPPYNIQHPSETAANHLARLRLNFVPTTNNRMWVNLLTDPGKFNNTVNGNSRLGVAENHQAQGGGFALIGWEWLGSQTFFPMLQVGLLYNFLEIGPQGWLGDVDFTGCEQFNRDLNCSYDRNRPQRFNSNDLTTWYQGDAYQIDKRYKMQIDPSLTIRANFLGSHTIKTGIQAQFVYRTRKAEVPGRFSFEDLNEDGLLLEEGLCNPMTGAGCFRRVETEPLDAKERGYAVGLFVQDRWWTPLQWLTVNPGLRADVGYTEDRLGRRIYRLFGLGPRLGATADVTRDGRNILFAYYGRHTEPMSLATASSVDAIEASRDITTEWDPMTMDYTTPVSISGGPGGIIIDTKAKMPRSDEITGGVRREIFANSVASVEYTWKRIAHTWDTLEINRVWDPSGSRVIGWRDPMKEGRDVQFYTTPENARHYHGVVFATEGQPTPNWDYLASYTLSWNYGTFRTDNPRQQRFSDGFLSRDQRHYIRFGGSYTAFNQLTIGTYMQYQSGSPLTKGFYNAFDNSFGNSRSPSGTTTTTPNDIAGISEFRLPDFFRMDIRLAYNVLPHRFRNRLNLVLDVFNAMNLRAPTGITTSDVARFGQVSARQSPFRAQLGVTWSY